MPVIRKQKIVSNGAPARIDAVPGSVLSRAILASQIKDSWIKMLMYGPGGVGKTTLACDFEKPLLVIALERTTSGGSRSARKIPGVHVVRPGVEDFNDDRIPKAEDVVADTKRLADELTDKNPFKTIVFDHVTVFQDWVLEVITGKPLPAQLGLGKITGDQYTLRAEQVKDFLKPWVDMPCNTVFIGKEKDHNPPKEEKISPKTGKVQPDLRPKFIRGIQSESLVTVELGGGAAGWLMDCSEYACRLYWDREIKRVVSEFQGEKVVTEEETGKYVPALRVRYHPNFFARFRSDDPKCVPDAIPNPTYQKIRDCIDGKYKE